MANLLWVTEYNSPADHSAVKEPAIRSQRIDFAAGSTQSLVFGDDTRCVRLCADTACCVLFGLDPTATTAHQRVAANIPELRQVKSGDRLAAILAA